MGAGYSIFTNVPAPQVDINLYANAARAGTDIGSKTPNLFGAIAEGVTGGIQSYDQVSEAQNQITAGQQQNELRQHQIDREPQQDALQDVQLENAKVSLANSKTQNDIQTQTESNKIAVTNTTLNNQLMQQKQFGQDLSTKANINDAFSQNSPEGIGNVLADPSFKSLASRDTGYGQSVYQQVLASTAATDEQKAQAKAGLSGIQNAQVQLQLATLKAQSDQNTLKAFSDARAKLLDSPTLAAAMNDHNLSESDLAGPRVQTYPAGTKSYDENGKIDLSQPDRTPAIGTHAGDTDLVVDGFKVSSPLEKEGFKTLQAIKQGYRVINPNIPPQSSNAAANQQASAAPDPAAANTPYLSLFGRNGGAPNIASAGQGAVIGIQAGGGTPPPTTGVTTPQNNLGPQVPPAPTPDVGTGIATTGNHIVDQQAAVLNYEAKNNPDLSARLMAKGLTTAPANTPTPTPSPTATVPASSLDAPPMQSVNIDAGSKSNAPTPTATPQASIKKVAYQISQSTGKDVQPKVITSILKNPELSDLDSVEKGIVAVESHGDAKAQPKNADGSPASSAYGYFQLTDAAAKDSGIDNKYDSKQNVQGGVNYYNSLVGRFNGNKYAALVAYNLGPDVVNRAIQTTGSADPRSIFQGIEALKNEGYRPKLLTDGNINSAREYPLHVLAYASAFQGVSA